MKIENFTLNNPNDIPVHLNIVKERLLSLGFYLEGEQDTIDLWTEALSFSQDEKIEIHMLSLYGNWPLINERILKESNHSYFEMQNFSNNLAFDIDIFDSDMWASLSEKSKTKIDRPFNAYAHLNFKDLDSEAFHDIILKLESVE